MEASPQPVGNPIKLIVGTLAVVVVVGGLVWYWSNQNISIPETPAVESAPSIDALLMDDPDLAAVSAAPAGARVTPPDEVLTGPRGEEVRIFNVVATSDGFSPARLVVKKGVGVQINFTATGGKYDLAVALPIGAYIVAEEGKTKVFGFTPAESGTYVFKCKEWCPEGGAEGELIVTES